MVKTFLASGMLLSGVFQQAAAQPGTNVRLLNVLPESPYCDRQPSCVVAASFRVLQTIDRRFRVRDTIWAYIACPENFSPGFWLQDGTYELQLHGDTSSIRDVPKLSFPAKPPVGMVWGARRIRLR